MSGSTSLTSEAKYKGRNALIKAFDTDYEEGIAELRSFENEEIENIAATLFKAENLDQLLGIRIGILASVRHYFPEEKVRAGFMREAIDGYIKAVCDELSIPYPDLGKKLS